MLTGLRAPEKILLVFFAYIVVLSGFFPHRPNLHYQPLIVLAVVAALIAFTIARGKGRFAEAYAIARDWLPLLLTFVAFREMELFLPLKFDFHYENIWIHWDRILLHDWNLRAAIESLGWPLPFLFELSYLLVYGVAAYSIGLVQGFAGRRNVDRFWVVYLTGTLSAYALFPFFPSQPPRYVFPNLEPPTVITWVRTLNLWLLHSATIHSGVFPSAHVSSAFSAAWGLLLALPRRPWFGRSMAIYAVCVSIATIYGRYHYAVDALAGFGLSLVAAAVAILLGRNTNVQKHQSAAKAG